jgi:broad specificity phosphatase PhoE
MAKLYLLRHFKVLDTSKKKLDSAEFNTWVDLYDTYDLEYQKIDLPKVDIIYTSSLKRTQKTAELLDLEYISDNRLDEVDTKAFFQTKRKFSKTFWLFINRILWFLNLSSVESKKQTTKRANDFIDSIDLSKDILIISHGLFLKILIKELQKNGYHGKIDLKPKNGIIYQMERL